MTQPDVHATLQVRFVDDDTLVRTGRALLEVNGHGWVMVPVPAGWAEQVKAVLDAAVEADTISTYVEAAEAAAASAEADRVVVEQAAMSASWSGDKLTVLGATSPPLTGETGPAGVTPHVGANGNWFVGDTDTGVRAQGEQGIPGDGAGDVLWSELNPVLDGKADVGHDHTIEQVTGLQDELDGKADVGHDHTIEQVTGLQDELDGKADVGHDHTIEQVTGLQDELDDKADTSHKHTSYDISDKAYFGGPLYAYRAVMWGSDGHLYQPNNPTDGHHLTRKGYVDARTPEIRTVSSPEMATSPGVLYVVMED